MSLSQTLRSTKVENILNLHNGIIIVVILIGFVFFMLFHALHSSFTKPKGSKDTKTIFPVFAALLGTLWQLLPFLTNPLLR